MLDGNLGSSPLNGWLTKAKGDRSMSEAARFSRRTSLKVIGALGATAAFGATAATRSLAAEAEKKEDGSQAKDAVALAVERFDKGHSCAQAVFSVFAEQLGVEHEAAARVSAGFGGGMGMGSICGAVTGAIMAIGLKYGGTDPKAKAHTAKLVREFTDRFKTQHQFLTCRELLGCDLSTPEGRRLSKEKKLQATVCNGLVADAAKILQELLASDRQKASG
jgi:C_GCAxxG_C_C family probable redox protein